MGEPGAPELSLFFDCHGTVLALPVRRVERLLLSDEVTVEPERQGVSIAVAGNQRYAAWNLGALLELAPFATAWVLLRVPHEGAELPLALSTGRCLLVAPLTQGVSSLPPGLFRGRNRALWGTFPVTGVEGAKLSGVMGLCLDPLHLWSPEELALSAASLLSSQPT